MAETLYISPSAVRFSAGKFNSTYRYVRGNVAASSTTFPMIQGRTTEVRRSSTVGTSSWYTVNWHHDNTVTEYEYDTEESSGSTFSASAVTVDI